MSPARPERARVFRARHEGACWACNGPIVAGDPIGIRGGRWLHAACMGGE